MLGEDDNSCFVLHLHFGGDGTPLISFGLENLLYRAGAGNGLKLSVPSEACFAGITASGSPILVGWVPY